MEEISFQLDAHTRVDDQGYYAGMFDMFEKGMRIFGRDGVGAIAFEGKTYHYFVHWLLDHYHTMKGMQYFEGIGHEIVDFFRKGQREKQKRAWKKFVFMNNNQPTNGGDAAR